MMQCGWRGIVGCGLGCALSLAGCTFTALVGENPRAPDVATAIDDARTDDAPTAVTDAPTAVTDASTYDAPSPSMDVATETTPDVESPPRRDVGRAEAESVARDAMTAPLDAMTATLDAMTVTLDDAAVDEAVVALDVTAPRCVSDLDCESMRPPARCEAASGRCVPR